MALPPKLTKEQRDNALAIAAASRKRRAEIKALLKSEQISIADVLVIGESDSAIAKLRVSELLAALPGWGSVRAMSMIERLEISSTRRVGGLGRAQREKLLAEFRIGAVIQRKYPGSLLVLSGPGGVGKSTVAAALRLRREFWVSISATTRLPRDYEIEGREYFFISDDEFASMVSRGDFLEWAEFAGAKYGTPKSAVISALESGKNVLLEIDINGAMQVKASGLPSQLIFLAPPSWEDLAARLESRGSDTPERRAHRLEIAQEELARAKEFDVTLVNDRVENVVEGLIALASARSA